jgi:DNA-binding HxlR family transcriptional regulator
MSRNLLSCRWAITILLKLSESPKRPSELKKEINGISEMILYNRLKILTDIGLIEKNSNNSYPLDVKYKLLDYNFVNDINEILYNLNLPVDRLIDVLSKKWVIDILEVLNNEVAPKEILARINGLKEKVLYERIKELEEIKMIERLVYNTRPITIKYRLTFYGRKALPTLRRVYYIILSK